MPTTKRNPVPESRKERSVAASGLWRGFLKARQRAVAMLRRIYVDGKMPTYNTLFMLKLQPQFYKMYDAAVLVENLYMDNEARTWLNWDPDLKMYEARKYGTASPFNPVEKMWGALNSHDLSEARRTALWLIGLTTKLSDVTVLYLKMISRVKQERRHNKRSRVGVAWRDMEVFTDQWDRSMSITTQAMPLYRRVESNYPWVNYAKHRQRILRGIARLFVRQGREDIWQTGINYGVLLSWGIPAKEIAGPFFAETFKSPKEFVKHLSSYGEMIDRLAHGQSEQPVSSPTVRQWISSVNSVRGTRYDPNDYELIRRLEAAAVANNGNRLSWRMIGRVLNEIERERAEKNMEDYLVVFERFASRSEQERAQVVDAPDAPPGWHWFGPQDFKRVASYIAKWHLCVGDQMRFALQQPHHDAFWHALLCDNEKIATVMGLNTDFICPSRHMACGRQNEVDEDAYDFFSREWWVSQQVEDV